MGNSVYGEVGKDLNMSGMNIKAIGKIKNVYVWFSFDELSATNNWADVSDLGAGFFNLPFQFNDADGNPIAPDVDPLAVGSTLYAFEIEHFVSKNPIPSGVTGGDPGSGVKFFGGGLNDDGTISTTPYTPIINPYVPSNG